ncbi:MAG: glycine cleavage system aminomethyltransferase GcvT [Hyphomicrobiales bacterium]|nr:glycine cleavage system aminomethyltransferase GcvT [Hyphomicrobiales bacterium]
MSETTVESTVQTAGEGPAREAAAAAEVPALKSTPLHDAHVALGARMVPFAGYEMPVQYPTGILAEHLHTRASAGIFDVSHMGQAFLMGSDHATTAKALESLVPADILNLAPGRQRYTQLLNEDGGILDDLMVTRSSEEAEDGVLMLIVNAACKDQDFAHIEARLPQGVRLMRADHRALVALQGPKSAEVLAHHCGGVAEMPFMSARTTHFDGLACHVSRSGYTGEDGYEISIKSAHAVALWSALLRDGAVKPIGLGARDSLRLEAGLCLYGHDIDTTTSPVEAALAWSVQKRRREEGGFPGAERLKRELAQGTSRKRVGILPDGKAPAREGTEIQAKDGRKIGTVTSGGFGPTLGGPLAMGYVEVGFAAIGTEIDLLVRGKTLPAKVASMPFVPNRYFRPPTVAT